MVLDKLSRGHTDLKMMFLSSFCLTYPNLYAIPVFLLPVCVRVSVCLCVHSECVLEDEGGVAAVKWHTRLQRCTR